MAARPDRGPSSLSPLRTVALGIGFACALAATLAIFLTDNPQYLRIGILVALWGFVFAALAAGRRQTEQVVAAGAEVELRRNYEAELEREVVARREYEMRLEVQLRRELQDNFAAQVGDLREEMTRLRHELSEQWDSELRVERMVMRTQSVRMGGQRRDAIEHGSGGLSRPAPIEAAPIEAESPDSEIAQAQPVEALSWEADEAESEPVEASSWDAKTYATDSSTNVESNGHVDRNSQDDVIHEGDVIVEGDEMSDDGVDEAASTREFPAVSEDVADAAASTREFPAVVVNPPSHPTAPVPHLMASTSIPSPPLTPDPAPPTLLPPTPPEGDDVLARVLAEAGSATGGRRRRHRYADEDED